MLMSLQNHKPSHNKEYRRFDAIGWLSILTTRGEINNWNEKGTTTLELICAEPK